MSLDLVSGDCWWPFSVRWIVNFIDDEVWIDSKAFFSLDSARECNRKSYLVSCSGAGVRSLKMGIVSLKSQVQRVPVKRLSFHPSTHAEWFVERRFVLYIPVRTLRIVKSRRGKVSSPSNRHSRAFSPIKSIQMKWVMIPENVRAQKNPRSVLNVKFEGILLFSAMYRWYLAFTSFGFDWFL